MAGKLEDWITMYQNKLAASEKSVEAYGQALAKQANEKTQLKYRCDELDVENKKLKENVSKLETYAKDFEKGTNQDQNKNSLTAYSAALEEETRRRVQLQASKDEIESGVKGIVDDFSKLKEHVKDCEKAVQKAQKEAKDAKGFADHRINSQKGQLRNAERNWDKLTRELRGWTEKYGTVDKPAGEKIALQQNITELQAKAEEARNQIKVLETQIRGTPEQIGLHQALEQWEEHQGCSKAFMDIEDKVDDLEKREEKLKSDLMSSNQKYQNAKADIQLLQTQLGQATQGQGQDNTNYMQRILQLESDLQASGERNLKTELDLRAVANQFLQAQLTFQHHQKIDVNMSDDDTLDKAKVESYLNAFQAKHQQTVSDMNALKEKADQLEQANKEKADQLEQANKAKADQLEQAKKAFQDADKTRKDLEKLQSDLQTAQKSHQATKSDMEVLQGNANQLEEDLRITKEEYQKSKTEMEGNANALESDLEAASGKYQTMESNMKSNMEKLERKVSGQQADLRIAKMDLETAKHEHQTVKSELEDLQGKAKTLQEASQQSQKKQEELHEEMENYRRLYEASQKAAQHKNKDHEMADVKEDENELLKHQAGSSKPEDGNKTQQDQVSSAAHAAGIDLFLSCILRASFSC